jgi:hypothetical protein
VVISSGEMKHGSSVGGRELRRSASGGLGLFWIGTGRERGKWCISDIHLFNE